MGGDVVVGFFVLCVVCCGIVGVFEFVVGDGV